MDAIQKLRSLAVAAHQKIHKNRYKDKTAVGKWEVHAHDEQGGRTWENASIGFLLIKLKEEVKELEEAIQSKSPLPDVRWEAADVCAMAMMVADNWKALPEVPKVVCLCGSTKFKDLFEKANFEETMAGNIVLSVGFFPHSEGYNSSPGEKSALDILHKRKIDLADEILVVSRGGYVGESTQSEIDYARETGKSIRWLAR